MKITNNAVKIATEAKAKVDDLEDKLNSNKNKITNINQRIDSISDSFDANIMDLEKKMDDKIKEVREDMIRSSVSSWEELVEMDKRADLGRRIKDIEDFVKTTRLERERRKKTR